MEERERREKKSKREKDRTFLIIPIDIKDGTADNLRRRHFSQKVGEENSNELCLFGNVTTLGLHNKHPICLFSQLPSFPCSHVPGFF